MAWTSSIYDHFIIWPSSVTLTFNLLKQMFQMALLLLKENTCAKLFWYPCINVEGMVWISSIYDHFIIWPSSVTLTFNLPKQMFQMALLLLKKNTCAKLFWYQRIKVEVMAWTSSIYDHSNIWPSSVTLTFKRPKQMFQMAPLLLKENTCVNLFRNLCIIVEVIARTSSIDDHFIIWLSSVTLTFNLPKQMFQMSLLLFKENTCAKLFWNPCINVEVIAWTSSSYGHFIIWLSSVTLTFNLPKQMFQMSLHLF